MNDTTPELKINPLQVLVFMVSFVTLLLFASFILKDETYQNMDKAGETIDCEQMLEDSVLGNGNFDNPGMRRNNVYTVFASREAIDGYKFKQCRDEIEHDRTRYCDYAVHGTLEKLKHSKRLTPYNNVCEAELEEMYQGLNDEVKIVNNAVITHGVAFNKNATTVYPVEQRNVDDNIFYSITLESGVSSITLSYADEEKADLTHAYLMEQIFY